MIRVAVADDQPLVRGGFRTLVEHSGDMELVGEASNGEEAVTLATEACPDLFLMDIRMPGLDGIEATRRIAQNPRCSAVKVVILTTFDLDEYVVSALRAGASGFLLKDMAPEDLLQAIRVVASGEALLSPRVTRKLIEEFVSRPETPRVSPGALESLTERELEVLALIAQGLSNAEISERLVVSAATTKTHIGHILTKLQARDRAQLVMLAYETGLVKPHIS